MMCDKNGDLSHSDELASPERRKALLGGAGLAAAAPFLAGLVSSAQAQGAGSGSGSASAASQGVEIHPNGSSMSVLGKNPDNFTGHVVITPLFGPNDTTRANAGLVTFAPGARTTWHTHPAGQLLFITAGQGWVQEEGAERRTVNAGDVVWFAAEVKHWHGATATSPMAHIAMTYVRDGKNVDWLEPVTDQQFTGN